MTDRKPKAVVFARKPTPRERFPDLVMQCRLLEVFGAMNGMKVIRTYESTDSHYLVARDVIDATVGFAIREGVDALLLWSKEMFDDDSLELIAEVSHTYGIDVWFLSDDMRRPWNEDDVDARDPHARLEVFVTTAGGRDAQ